MKKTITLSLFVLIAVLLTACGSSDSPAELLDTTWEWQQLVVTDPASQSMIADSPNYTLFLSSDGFADVEADCNFVQGKFEISGDKLTFKVNAPALVECGLESSYCPYLFRLVQVESYQIEDGRLVLSYGEGAGKLIFANVGTNLDDSSSGEGTGNGESVGDVGSKKVTVCHKPKSKNPVSIEISRSALQAHLNHGDVQGLCP
jgi:hypothetical protein